MNGSTLRLAAGLLVVLALAGCGKKGPPQAPKDEPNTYPRAYPYDASKPFKPDSSVFPTNDDTNNNPITNPMQQPQSTE